MVKLLEEQSDNPNVFSKTDLELFIGIVIIGSHLCVFLGCNALCTQLWFKRGARVVCEDTRKTFNLKKKSRRKWKEMAVMWCGCEHQSVSSIGSH